MTLVEASRGGQHEIARRAPVFVIGMTDAVGTSVGQDHACARLRDGGLACRGAAGDGQTGNHVKEVIKHALDVKL